MAQIAFSPAAFRDFERFFDFYSPTDPALAKAQVEAIHEAISLLEHHPLVGRIVKRGLRELVISRGKSGFVALYRYKAATDRVTILRIRHQRELRYPQG